LLAVLDPDVVMRADAAAMQLEGTAELRGAQAVAQAFKGRARSAQSALVNGAVGVVVAPRGELLLVLNITVVNDKITAIDAIADPERLAGFRSGRAGDVRRGGRPAGKALQLAALELPRANARSIAGSHLEARLNAGQNAARRACGR
jgi:hypothetical protein